MRQNNELLSKAIRFHSTGDLKAAEKLYRSILQSDAENAVAGKNLAALLIQIGHVDEARDRLLDLSKSKTRDCDILDNLAYCLLITKDYESAIRVYGESIDLDPLNSHGHNGIGNAYLKAGHFVQAERHYEVAHQIEPNDPEFLYNLGLARHKNRNYQGAATAYLMAIKLNPNIPEVYNNLALSLFEQSHFSEAEIECQKAIQLRPKFYEAFLTYTKICVATGRPSEAERKLELAIKMRPDGSEAMALKSQILGDLGRFQEALFWDEANLRQNPESAVAWNSKGASLAAIGRTEDAILAFQRATEIDPNLLEAWVGLGNCHSDLLDLNLARDYYRKALSIDPDCHLANYQIGLTLLRERTYSQETWSLFRERWKTKAPEFLPRYQQVSQCDQPDLGTKRILLWAEQGIGENLLFGSLLTEIERVSSHVTVSLDERLGAMFSRRFPGMRFVPREFDPSNQEFDCQMSLGDLGLIFRANVDSFQRQPKTFLYPLPDRISHWKRQLSGKKLNIGICWESKNPKFGPEKTIAVELWAQWLDIPNVRIVSLQYDASSEDRLRLNAHPNFFTPPGLDLRNDLEDVLALSASCDLIITVSSALAHICGAAGIPALVLLPQAKGRFWFWGIDSKNCIWYPSLTLVNQTTQGDWSQPINAVTAQIHDMLKHGLQ
jgi:tetratricopeptide (TPR) repeat protein